MRVLLIVHGFPPRALGGTEIYTSHLARTLRRAQVDEVSVLTREAAPDRPEYALRRERRHGVEIFSINHTFRDSRSFEDTYRNPAIGPIAARVIDDVAPDVAHIQHLTCLTTDLVAELERRRVPICYTLNDYWLICPRGQLFDLDLRPCDGPHRGCRRCIDQAGPGAGRAAVLWRRLERRLPGRAAGLLGRGARSLARGLGDPGKAGEAMARRMEHVRRMAARVNLFLAPSDTLRRRFLDFGFPAERLRPFRQGIDLRPFAGLERSSSDRLRIGFLGSLMVSKAPHLLLEAFAGLPRGAATLEIYGGFAAYHGDDSYRRRLEPLLAARGVRHHGPVPNAEVPRALAAIDVLAVPSVWLENAPFVIREAFAAGVPVVASDRGGMAEMVAHEKSGLLFRPGDAGELRRALARLIDEPELLRRLRAGIPPPRSIEEVAGDLRQIYRDLIREAAAESARAAAPRLAAVVLNYRTPRETLLAVRSLESSERPVDEILVVDNASGDGSAAWLRERLPGGVRLLRTERNLGFSGGSNAGIRAALEGGAERVLLLNGDAMAAADCAGRLEEALDAARSDGIDAGIAGATLLAANDPSRIASRGMDFSPLTGRMRHPDTGRLYDRRAVPQPRRVAAVSGCGMLVERRIFAAAGLLDEDYFFSFEDLDFCLRAARAGFATLAVGDAVVYHHGGRSIGPASPRRLYFAARNHLLAARRGVPLHPLLEIPRTKMIIALNLAFAALVERVPGGVRAVVRGVFDYLRGRYGDGGFGDS